MTEILLLNYKLNICLVWDAVVTLSETQGHRAGKYYIDLLSDYLYSKLDGNCLKSFWNNRTFIISWLRSVWHWVKVKVKIINMWCILMYGAVTVPTFDDDDFNNFRGIAFDGQTHRQTQTETHTGIDTASFMSPFSKTVKTKQKLW